MRIWEAAARLTGDPDFGLHLAEWVSLCPEEHFDVLAYAVQSCATLGEHYRRMERYVRLIHEGSFLSLEVSQDEARLVHGVLDRTTSPRHPVECMLALAVLQARRAVGDDFSPQVVYFSHPAPSAVVELERVFRAPVHFGSSRNELLLERAQLDRPQRKGEARLHAMLDRQIEELLSQLPVQSTFIERVMQIIASNLSEGEPTVDVVASALRHSPRTLQRKLRDEGLSFTGLLAEVRRDLALRYLRNTGMTIQEVTFLLGFGDVSAFHRAFKRWTGTTPGDYQRSG